MEVIKRNSRGQNITDLQRRLKLLGYNLGLTEIDGVFGPNTEEAVRKFQQDRGLIVTGAVDSESWQELVDAGYAIGERLLYLKYPPFRGDDVKTLQLWLKILGFYSFKENGIFCENTHRALLEFQNNMNITDDGIVGRQTLQHLKNLKRLIDSKKTFNIPYIKDFLKMKKTPAKIIIDYCGLIEEKIINIGDDSELISRKVYICKGIANYCKDFIEGKGLDALLTNSGDENQNLFIGDRIDFANKNKADFLISINLGYSSEKDANGCSCYYFKGLKSFSAAGRRMANLIQDRLIKNINMVDCRVHGASYAILKETEMISVMVEPAFISNPKEESMIRNSDYQKKIAENVCIAVMEYLNEN